LAEAYEFTYFEISAKDGKNIRQAFQHSVERAYLNIQKVEERYLEKAGAKKLMKPITDLPPIETESPKVEEIKKKEEENKEA